MKVLENNKNLMKNMLIICGLFLIPTFLEQIINLGSYKQFVIGTIVNASLIYLGIVNKTSTKNIVLLSTLPSVSTICSGLLFTGLTFYSKVMIPFIWLGNLSFVYLYRYFYIKKENNYCKSGVISLLIKVFIIFGGFTILSNVLNFPIMVKETLKLSMGLYQLITGTLGIILIYILGITKKEK